MRRGASQIARANIPRSRREHPGPLVLVEVDEDLGVALRAERVAPGLEPAPEGGEVVDLAVEDGPDRAVLVRERLMPAGQVDDRQPAEPERGVVVAVGPGVVRARGGRSGPSSPPGRSSASAAPGSVQAAPQMPHMLQHPRTFDPEGIILSSLASESHGSVIVIDCLPVHNIAPVPGPRPVSAEPSPEYFRPDREFPIVGFYNL